MSVPFASRLDAIPVVPTTAFRNAFYGSTTTINQRVQNLETGDIERWTGNAWVVDFSGGTGAPVLVGTGSPEGVVAADLGTLYQQSDTTVAQAWWLKQAGSGTTGWVPVATGDGRTNAQRLLAKLTHGVNNATLMMISDSTGTTNFPWFVAFCAAFAPQFPAYTVTTAQWNITTHTYDAPVTIQTGTGGQTLAIYNFSIGGASTGTFVNADFNTGFRSLAPDYCFISLGHNEAPTEPDWRAAYIELVLSLLQAVPTVALCVIAQNPELSTTVQGQRADTYAQIAAEYGLGFIDVYQAFQENGGAAVLNNPDGVHPNAAGQALWALVVNQAMVYDHTGLILGSGYPWLAGGEELLTNGDFSNFTGAVPDGWSVTGGATISKDVVNYESPNFYSVKVTAVGTTGTLSQTLPAGRLAGNWLTVIAREYVASGQPDTSGKVGISDGVGPATSTRNNALAQGVFRWKVWQQLIDPSSTAVTIFLYGDQGSSPGTGSASFDRVSARIGKAPILGVLNGAVAAGRVQPGFFGTGTYVFGANTGGVTEVAVNSAAGNARNARWKTANVTRWTAQVTSDAETGSNAGSGFRLIAADDTGVTIDNVFDIIRAAGGIVTLSRPFTVQGNVLATSGLVTVGASTLAGTAQTVLNAAAGQARNLLFQSGGSNRWFVQATSTAESGGNAGSDWVLVARSDTGTAIDTPITVVRAAGGNITITRPLVGLTASPGTSSTVMATTAFVAASFAPLASPAFTGTPSLPTGTTGITQSAANNSTALATTAYVDRTPGTTTVTAAAPTGTTSATAVMMGLAGTITPTKTGRVTFTISGQMANNTLNDGVTVDLRTGTGTAPTNGAAVTGTLRGVSQTATALIANERSGFSLTFPVTGLTLGTAVWYDLSLLAVTGGTASVTGITGSAVES